MLLPEIRDLARAGNFAALSTLMPDGAPQTTVMWVDADDDHLLINTQLGRQKVRNVERDPRVTVTIWDKDDPYRFAEVRGTVVETVDEPEARAQFHRLANRYFGHDFLHPITAPRIIWKITPDRQYMHG